MSTKYKGVLFARDGSKYEGGAQEVTLLHHILQCYSAFSDVIQSVQLKSGPLTKP